MTQTISKRHPEDQWKVDLIFARLAAKAGLPADTYSRTAIFLTDGQHADPWPYQRLYHSKSSKTLAIALARSLIDGRSHGCGLESDGLRFTYK